MQLSQTTDGQVGLVADASEDVRTRRHRNLYSSQEIQTVILPAHLSSRDNR